MAASVAAVAGSGLLVGWSVFGMHDGPEQPPYDIAATVARAIEIRQHGPRLVAETVVADPDGGGADGAFRILAGDGVANRDTDPETATGFVGRQRLENRRTANRLVPRSAPDPAVLAPRRGRFSGAPQAVPAHGDRLIIASGTQ